MKSRQTRRIVATAISAAAIAVAIDHTRQRLPESKAPPASKQAVIIIDEGEVLPGENNGDCGVPPAPGKRASPCSL